jgi:hypothetical protein
MPAGRMQSRCRNPGTATGSGSAFAGNGSRGAGASLGRAGGRAGVVFTAAAGRDLVGAARGWVTGVLAPHCEHLPRLGQAAGERALGDAQLPGRVLARPAFQLAQDDGSTVAGRQALDFLVEDLPPVLAFGRRGRRLGHDDHLLLTLAAAGQDGPGFEGGPPGHAVQPARHPVARHDARRLAGQDEERRLEAVLGVVGVRQQAPADAHHHRPVAAHQRRERRLVAPGQERFQQPAVGHRVGGLGRGGRLQVLDHGFERTLCHAVAPLPALPLSALGRRGRGASVPFCFFWRNDSGRARPCSAVAARSGLLTWPIPPGRRIILIDHSRSVPPKRNVCLTWLNSADTPTR